MEINWTTFIFEIINFLILIWLLQRLLYLPVKKAIKLREENLQGVLSKASETEKEASAIKQEYAVKLKTWDKEKELARDKYQQELASNRQKELENLKEELAQQKEKNLSIIKQELQQELASNIKTAMNIATNFVSNVLKDLADSNLEEKIIALFLKKLENLNNDQLGNINQALEHNLSVNIQTAFELTDMQKQDLINNIQNKLQFKSQNIKYSFTQDNNLIAGINLIIGSVGLRANLCDELKYFTEISHES